MSQTLNNDASIHNHTQPRAPLSLYLDDSHSLTDLIKSRRGQSGRKNENQF